MNRTMTGAALCIALATTAAFAAPADPSAGKPAPGTPQGMMGEGSGSMMGNMGGMDMKDMKGMMDMMDMMGACQAMMDKGGMQGGASSLRLPPGNEKLEFQMHAEMTQKMGEIAARYADRIRDGK